MLTPALIAEIQAARARGEHYSVLAKRFDVSEGTVRNAIKAPAASAPSVASVSEPETAAAPTDTAVAPTETTAPPTQEDVRRWLGEQVAGLRADVDRLRKAGDRPGLAAANRQLVTASSLLARVTPPDPTHAPDGFVLVSAKEMEEHARRPRELLMQYVDRYYELRASWPKCATCEQPTRPVHFPKDAELSPAMRLGVAVVETQIAKDDAVRDLITAVGLDRARKILTVVVETTLQEMAKR